MPIIGTRGSLLATTQAGHVRDALTSHGYPSELRIVTTTGDVNLAPVERIGVGVFTQALRDSLLAGECDIAVHSFKDLPTAVDERFHLVVPYRENARDCLIARNNLTLVLWLVPALLGELRSLRRFALIFTQFHYAAILILAWRRFMMVN